MNDGELRGVAAEIRRQVLRAVHHAGAGHIGGVFSAAEMLATLYFRVLDVDPARPGWTERDRFILSKGHCAIGLYAVLAMRGYFPVDELQTFDAIDSRLQGHPDMTLLPGLDMSTGSLGQGLSPGLGMGLAARIMDKKFHTWVMLGDGELQEGQIWEAAFAGSRYELDNVTAIVDWNHLQQFGWSGSQGYTSPLRRDPADDPAARFRSCGWNVIECDGHSIPEFSRACEEAKACKGRPSAIVANTVKGKGVSFMEGDYTWHSRPMSDADLARALEELAV